MLGQHRHVYGRKVARTAPHDDRMRLIVLQPLQWCLVELLLLPYSRTLAGYAERVRVMIGKIEVGADETRKRRCGEYPQRLAKVSAIAVESIRTKGRRRRQPHNDKAPHMVAYLEQLSGERVAALHDPERHTG